MKRTVTRLLALSLLLALATVANAAARQIGDVYADGVLNAKDVTAMRRCIADGAAGTADFSIADTNGDGFLNAKDITLLRRCIAGGYGVTLGTIDDEPADIVYTDSVTGGQLYTDLGKPQFGAGKYALTVLVDGEPDASYAEALAAKIRSGNKDALTPAGSRTEAFVDEENKTVTLSNSRYYLAQISGVYPAEGEREAYVTLKKVDWHPIPAGEVAFRDGSTRAEVFITDDYSAEDVKALVAYTKADGVVKTLARAEIITGAAGDFTHVDGMISALSVGGTSYPIAASTPGFSVAAGTSVTAYLDPNGCILYVKGAEEDSYTLAYDAMLYTAVKADKAKGDPRSMPTDETPSTVKLLIVGNSFGNDCSLYYLTDMLKEAGVQNVIVGTLYYSGCTYRQHYAFGTRDQGVYDYYENGKGVWLNTATLDYALHAQDWNFVLTLCGGLDRNYAPCPWQDILLYHLRRTCPDAYYGFIVPWADRGDSTRDTFIDNDGGSQLTMYNTILDVTRRYVVPEQRFKFLCPVATAIQNARTSFIGDHTDRDGYHMNKGIGRYIGTMTVCCSLLECSPDLITNLPSGLLTYIPAGLSADTPGMKEALAQVARESVKNARAHPWEITQSQYTTAP